MAQRKSPRKEVDRRAGRPRSASVNRAILRAAWDLFIERGLAGASIEMIAKRAGVAKTSIYRRWPSRDALLAQAIEAGRNESAPGYTAAVVERSSAKDFVQLVLGVADIMTRPKLRKLVTRLIGSVPDHPHLFEVYRERYFAPRRRAMVGALRRVQAAGALSAKADVEIIADMLAGTLVYRFALAPQPNDTPDKLRAYLFAVLQAIGIDLDAVENTKTTRSVKR